MAEVACVYDLTPTPRIVADILPADEQERAQARPAPAARGKWLAASVTDDAAAVIAAGSRRPPTATPTAPPGNHLAVVHALGGLAAIHAEQGARTATRLADERGLAEHWATTLARVAAGKALASPDEAEAVIGRAVELSQRGVAQVEHAYSLLTLAELRQTKAPPTRRSSCSGRRVGRWRLAPTRASSPTC